MNENIFKAYDIRGIYGEELTDKIAYYIGIAFGQKLVSLNKQIAIVGCDNRISSNPLKAALVKGILLTGIDIIDIGMVTTPMFYYAREYLEIPAGVVITASHSPAIYNGMKLSFDENGRIYGDGIQAFKEDVKKAMTGFVQKEPGHLKQFNMEDEYKALMKEKIILGSRKLKVVVDCGNGTASIIAPYIFEEIGCEVVPLFCDSDPSFPNHHPDPAVEENMTFLKAKVLETHADLGIGFDGDADRVGVVDELGNMIYADMYMAIILRDLMPRLTDKRALMDIKCSKALEDEIVKLGGTPIYNRPGNSYMMKIMNEQHILVGVELAGHVFFADEFYGYDDGVYAALRLVRILSNTTKTVSQLLEGINKYYATPEILVKASDESKFIIVNEVMEYAKSKNYKMLTLDGIRVLFTDGWALVRASNTGPNITLRFEATTNERLNEIKNEFVSALNEVIAKHQ